LPYLTMLHLKTPQSSMTRGISTVWVLTAVLTVLVLAIVLVVFLRNGDDVSETTPADTTVHVPEFSFPDADGALVSLTELEAPVRVVTFWASWSPYSRQELLDLARLKQTYGDRVAIAALNRDTDPSEGRAFLKSIGADDTLLFAYDTDDTYYKEVGGFNMPETVFVAQDNEVLHHQHGPMPYDEMVAVLEQLLDEE